MKYRISCYNKGHFLGIFNWLLPTRPNEIVVDVDAEDEKNAFSEAKKLITRDYYKIIMISG